MIAYLHGFASGPASYKGRALAERFARLGVPVELPALDEGAFDALTLTRQLAAVERLTRGGDPVALIGSSLGGYVAALHAAQHATAALVLLAPAVDFAARWRERLGPEAIARWQREDALEVFHYALGRNASVGWALMRDAALHAAIPKVSAPTLVLHGRRDDIVDGARVERFVAANPTARLEWLETDHEMVDAIDTIFERTRAFLAEQSVLLARYPGLRAG